MKGGYVMRNNVIFVDFVSRTVINYKGKKYKGKKSIFSSFLKHLKNIFMPSRNVDYEKCQIYNFKNIL